jgi:hypothetical protein
MPVKPKKYPAYVPGHHGNVFDWIIKTAAEQRDKQIAERNEVRRREIAARRRWYPSPQGK